MASALSFACAGPDEQLARDADVSSVVVPASGVPDSATSDGVALGSLGVGGSGSPGASAPSTDAALPLSLAASLPTPVPVPAGTLTAGAWDDNQNLERFLAYRAALQATQLPGMLDFDEQDHLAAGAASTPVPRSTLDVALVIDTTASMGDELAYLQSELAALSSAIQLQYPAAEQRWSLIVYRDIADEYVTRAFDFVGNGEEYRRQLAAQEFGGGGDYPEASEAALAAMNQLSWRTDDATARVAFWVTDAPHHPEQADALGRSIEVAQAQGIHLYPVASSGVDELTELTLRAAAQLTQGRYLFLTNDSGVGGDHKEPSIPCYFVTRLDDAMLRMLEIEMSGVYREPAPGQVLRAGGNPAEGSCALESGLAAFAF